MQNHPDFNHPAIVRVRGALAGHGLIDRIRLLDEATHTSQAAADHLGCDVSQIAKSVIFKGRESGSTVLVIASGRHRVDEKKVTSLLGERLDKADADFVRSRTGFVIGGVAPIGHLAPPVTFLDAHLGEHSVIWAAAGLPNSLFPLSPAELRQITGAAFHDVAKV